MKRIIAWLCIIALMGTLSACSGVAPQVLLDGQKVASLSMFAGQSLQLTAGECKNPKWASGDEAVLEVKSDGSITALSEGTAAVILKSSFQSTQVQVTVTPYVPVEQINCKKESVTVKAGLSKSLLLEILPENASDKSLTYTVSPNDGVLQFENGKVTASKDAELGKTYEVTVKNERSSVSATMQVKISTITELTAWTIGDSIFDFRDNSDTDMLQTALTQCGYGKLHTDNVSGTTIHSVSGMGIVDRIDMNLYSRWSDPELIILFRGTNDVYNSKVRPQSFTQDNIRASLEKTCKYFSESYPDARIVFITPMWRADIAEEQMDWMRQQIHEVCETYENIEVFDLHLQKPFADLSHSTFGSMLYDGIHLNDAGAEHMKNALIDYLSK